MVKKSTSIAILMILASLAAGACLYPQMPALMASHWNYGGQVDGYIPRFFGVFLMPLVSVVMLVAFALLPRIDPLGKNIEKFRKYYDLFVALVVVFLTYIYGLTLAWNLGLRFDMGLLIAPAVGLLLYYSGILMENAKRNWFIGIRTPWTMSSDRVWEKTHKLGGKLFKAAGVLAVLGAFFPAHLWLVALAPVIVGSLYTVVYSYLEYKKEMKGKK